MNAGPVSEPVAAPASVAALRPTAASAPEGRLASMDAYRGFVMFLMMAEVLRLSRVARNVGDNAVWNFLSWHQSHVDWVGCSLHDLIQPSFSFLVGVALPFSIASRVAKGQSQSLMTWHAVWRSLVLILLGVFLRSMRGPITNWTFEDTLSQIGLGYTFLFALGFRSGRDQWIALGVILVGYWAAFALYPLPDAAFDYAKLGVPKTWMETHGLSGFAAHWQKNSNAAWAADTWFLNLLPRKNEFLSNRGGYSTLSFIPTLGTMILGLVAGNVLRGSRDAKAKIRWFVIAGLIGLAAGWMLGWLGIVPVVKRIWTPSWVLFSGGWCFLLMGAFYFVIDVSQQKRWAFPLIVIGMNSIAAYLIAHLFEDFIAQSFKIHFGANLFLFAGKAYEPFFQGIALLAVMWLMLYWMYRRKVFLRI